MVVQIRRACGAPIHRLEITLIQTALTASGTLLPPPGPHGLEHIAVLLSLGDRVRCDLDAHADNLAMPDLPSSSDPVKHPALQVANTVALLLRVHWPGLQPGKRNSGGQHREPEQGAKSGIGEARVEQVAAHGDEQEWS